MQLCNNEDCMPCCDYCLHSIHESILRNGRMIDGGCIGCSKHIDAEHQDIAKKCGYCKDFHCQFAY